MIFKTVASRDGWDFVLSDATLDSYGDSIDPNGWDLSRFKTNPVALWDHGHDPEIGRTPIGRWENVRVVAKQLIGTFVPARGIMAKIDALIALIEQNFLRATSVGFQPKKQEPIDKNKPYAGQRYLEQLLLETSIVAVPANPATLALARSLNLSDDLRVLAFGEQADVKRRDLTANGEHADTTSADLTRSRVDRRPPPKAPKMTTLSQRIEAAQADLVAKRDTLVELTNAAELDTDAIEALNGEIEVVERNVTALKASEAKIGTDAGSLPAPAIRRPLGVAQQDVKPSDLIVRSAVCHFIAKATGKNLDAVLEDRYPGHEATAIVTKADATIATTTTSGWASQLVNTAMAELLDLLTPFSVYPGLAAKGIKVTFNNSQGAINIPSISTDAALAGGFVLEGDPIPVGRFTTAATTLTPHKFGIITTMSKEAAKYTTPALEGVLRRSILRRTAITLDGLLLDAVAGTTTRPAGLLNGVSALSAYGGGDYEAVINDINTLMAPFDLANAGRSMVLIMHPAQARRLAMMPGPDGTFGWADRFMAAFTVLTSTSATAGRVIAIDAEDFASATGDTPEFDVSDQTTLHMSDTPLELVSAGGTVADPTRSMFQTNSLALRMILPITWKMRRAGMIQYIDSVGW